MKASFALLYLFWDSRSAVSLFSFITPLY